MQFGCMRVCARVWDFWRDFARPRGIFLRESLSKVVEVLTACASVYHDEITGSERLPRVAREVPYENKYAARAKTYGSY
jgi:hypothetical protein